MITATALTSVGLFIGALWAFGAIRVAASVVGIAQGAVATIQDDSISDEVSEKEVQRASLRLMGAFLSILLRSAVALLVSFLPIWLANSIGLAAIEDVLLYLSRWDVILILTVALTAGYVIWGRIWPFK